MKDALYTCCHEWRAPRADVPTSMDVNHVCTEPIGHVGIHRCPCGARTEVTDE